MGKKCPVVMVVGQVKYPGGLLRYFIEIFHQSIITDIADHVLFIISQLLPDNGIHLDNAEGLCVTEYVHVLETLEGICENVAFDLLVRIAGL